MTRYEYDMLQEEFSKWLKKNNLYGKASEKDAREKAVNACKSILHNFQKKYNAEKSSR